MRSRRRRLITSSSRLFVRVYRPTSPESISRHSAANCDSRALISATNSSSASRSSASSPSSSPRATYAPSPPSSPSASRAFKGLSRAAPRALASARTKSTISRRASFSAPLSAPRACLLIPANASFAAALAMALDRTRRLRTSSACAAEAAFAADPKRLRSKSASADVPTKCPVAGRVHFSRTRSHTSFTSDAHNVELELELNS
mmetsp:Transcript_3017/g.12033  ORF Transcript_3017/g.12033 Transcript_3017/m.12033 type:complete len:204 (+) Transcript_3017:647-1258(+)